MSKRGFSLIEILVVIGLFAVIGVIATSSTADSIRGTKKSDATIRLRSNLELAVSSIDRRVRNAREISPCTGASMTSFSFIDEDKVSHTFECSGGSVSLDRTPISSDEISVGSCSFICTPGSIGIPPSLEISLEGRDLLSTNEQAASFKLNSKVNLRSY